MADLSDVESALVSASIGALYPNGTSQPSVIGVTCRVYRGWPSPTALNLDLAAGLVNVSVFPATAPDEILDRYFDRLSTTVPSTGLVASVAGQSITFSGLVAGNLSVGLLVDGIAVSYGTVDGDTNNSIAANLMVLISANRLALSSGPVLTIPGVKRLSARVVTNATLTQELRRQRREVRVSCWCPSPALRDTVCKAIDLTMATLSFISLPDGTKVHVIYASTEVYDQSHNAILFRRDLCYRCEYTVTSSGPAPVMLFGDLNKNGKSSLV